MTTPSANKRRYRRAWPMAGAVLGILSVGTSFVCDGPTLILWNASASVPLGLYCVQPNAPLKTGDLAVAKLPPDTEQLAAARRYLPRDVLLIKPVAALGGTTVCRRGDEIYIDGVHVADAQSADRLRRPMPEWQGCRRLAASEIFLMNPAVDDSFDGRYFGPIARSQVIGRAFPVLTFAQRPRT